MDIKFFKILNIHLLLFFLITGFSFAGIKDLGTSGNVYEIKEKDALREIETFMASMDNDGKKPIIEKQKAESLIKNYKPEGLISLPKAEETKTRYISPEHTLEVDIKDANGNVIYPKGYKFSPLEYMYNPRTYVVINANDPKQVEWFNNSGYQKKLDVTLLISEGGYYEFSKSVSTPVYYCLPEIHKKFQLEKVPSIVKQEGKKLKIVEQKID